MCISDSDFIAAKNIISGAQKIVIISHRGPDGDTVGANLALRRALKEQWGRQVISACVDTPPANCDFLPEVSEYVNDFDLNWPDLIIVVDAGAHYMTRFHETKPEIFAGKPPVLNIDHHASNDFFGTVNLVDAEAASATHIIYHFLKRCGFKIDRQIATCLLNGLYYDTGSFMHSNTSSAVLETASELLWKGADFKTIAKKQFHTMPVRQLKVYGKILERARVNSKKIAVSTVTTQDLDEIGASPDDTTGSIDYLNSIPEGSFCCLLYEDRRGTIKGSFRTRDSNVNLAKLAKVFGGGGHEKAAGFSFPGHLIDSNSSIKIEDV